MAHVDCVYNLENHFTKVYGLIIQIKQKSKLLLHDKILLDQAGHNFAHFTTAELSWNEQICDVTGSFDSLLKQENFFTYELLNGSWNGSQEHNSLLGLDGSIIMSAEELAGQMAMCPDFNRDPFQY